GEQERQLGGQRRIGRHHSQERQLGGEDRVRRHLPQGRQLDRADRVGRHHSKERQQLGQRLELLRRPRQQAHRRRGAGVLRRRLFLDGLRLAAVPLATLDEVRAYISSLAASL